MVPCPWFAEIAAAARNDAALDLGVHLTLTSEWEGYRWRAISTTSQSSGLLDDDGYLPRRCRMLRAQVVPEAAEIEVRAQIDRARASGIDATHLDTHMGAALVPELLAVTLRLGREYKLPVLLPRDLGSYLDRLDLGPVDPALYAGAVAELEKAGAPIVDHFRMTPGVPSVEAPTAYRGLLATLPFGLTFVALIATSRATLRQSCHLARTGAPTSTGCSPPASRSAGLRRWGSCDLAIGAFGISIVRRWPLKSGLWIDRLAGSSLFSLVVCGNNGVRA